MAASGTPQDAIDAMQAGYLTKPLSYDRLLDAVDTALEADRDQ